MKIAVVGQQHPQGLAEKIAAHRNTVEQLVGRTFTPSHREEIISALWIIAALLAWNGGIRWLAWILFVKGVTDTLASIGLALMELRKKANAEAHGRAVARTVQPLVGGLNQEGNR